MRERIAISPEASQIHHGLSADLRTITTAVSGGFTTPDGLQQALAAITRLQDALPGMRRELKLMRAGIRRAA